MTTYYVRRDGKDGNSGLGDTAGQAWHSIEYGSRMLVTGDTLIVQPGLWLMEQRMAGSSGTWVTNTRFSSMDIVPELIDAGDYLYTTTSTNIFRSFRISAIGTDYVDVEEDAGGSDPLMNRSFWVCNPDKIPRQTLSILGPADRVTFLFDGVEIDGNGLAATLVSLLAANCNFRGGKFHGAALTGKGLLLNNYTTAHVQGIEVYDCYRGIYLDGRVAASSLIHCRSHDNRDAGIYVACNYTGYYVGHLFGCQADHNAGDGFYLVNALAEDCLAFDNAGAGYNAATGNHTLCGCLATGNSKGAYVLSAARLINNIFYGNTIFDLDATGSANHLLARNNCIGAVAGTTLDDSNLTADPRFLDSANHDFRLHYASPCWNTGFAAAFLAANVGHVGPQGHKLRIAKLRSAVYARPRGTV